MPSTHPPSVTDVFVPAPRSRTRLPVVLLGLPHSATTASVRRGLRQEFGPDGVDVQAITDGIELLDRIRGAPTALVVLDMELPGPDPLVLLGAVLSEAPHAAIVVITARERRAGALGLLRGDRDDFLFRPFTVEELAVRIRLRLRATAGLATPAVLSHGGVSVRDDVGEVTVDGHPVALSPTEYALLLALLDRPGEVVSHAELGGRAWSEPVSANLVQVYISYLRRKIGSERIRTVRGAGYLLEG